jgi:hypothetical protein
MVLDDFSAKDMEDIKETDRIYVLAENLVSMFERNGIPVHDFLWAMTIVVAYNIADDEGLETVIATMRDLYSCKPVRREKEEI